MNNPAFAIQNFDGLDVATVTYADGTTFTTSDWQGSQPQSVDEIADFTWQRIDTTDPANTAHWVPAVVVLGWPRALV